METATHEVNQQHVEALAGKMESIISVARKVDASSNKGRSSVAASALEIAREAADLSEFNAAVMRANAHYKARFSKGKAKASLPKSWTQAVSDIRRMFNEHLDLQAKDADGNLASYAQLKKLATILRQKEVKEAQKAVDAATPEAIRNMRVLFKEIDSRNDEVLATIVLDTLKDAVLSYFKEHPLTTDAGEGEEKESIQEAA